MNEEAQGWPEIWDGQRIEALRSMMDDFGLVGEKVLMTIAWDIERNGATLQDLGDYLVECADLSARAAGALLEDQKLYLWFSCLMSDISPKSRSGVFRQLGMVLLMLVIGASVWPVYKIRRKWLQWRAELVRSQMSLTFTLYMLKRNGITPSPAMICECEKN